MKDCMPGETSDGEGVLGYCWMHHFKCHSARTCDTWAKGGPITTDKVSEGWQERAFAKPKASKIATEAGKATAKASESFDAESFEDFKRIMIGDGWIAGDMGYMEGLEEYYNEYLEDFTGDNPESFEDFQERILREDYADKNIRGGMNMAETFDVEFEEWGKQEMKTHGKDVSFKEWLKEESKSHGDVPLMDWAEHEEESHDERYSAEGFEAEIADDIYDTKEEAMERAQEFGSNKTHSHKINGDIVYMPFKDHKTYQEEMGAETFEADATSCFQCGRFGYDDEMMRIDYGYLCARCANPDVDFSKIMAAEESPKISKKLIGLLSIGALGAVLAPKEIRKLFDKFKKS